MNGRCHITGQSVGQPLGAACAARLSLLGEPDQARALDVIIALAVGELTTNLFAASAKSINAKLQEITLVKSLTIQRNASLIAIPYLVGTILVSQTRFWGCTIYDGTQKPNAKGKQTFCLVHG